MPVCFSILNVKGYKNKYNTVLYREPIIQKEDYKPKYVIFFPGDYSNFFANSIYTTFKTIKNYECTTYCYSYEALFWVVSAKYLSDYFIFIKPNTFESYFVHFTNFISESKLTKDGKIVENVLDQPTNIEGEETAVPHLICLLESLKTKLEEKGPKEKNCTGEHTKEDTVTSYGDTNEKNYQIVLIGFSKGCSVLIALLNETKEKYYSFWKNVTSILFLDPGYNKMSFCFLINEECLEKIFQYKLKIIVHSTLRQIYDEQNKCIHKRVYGFLSMLQKWNILIPFYLHYGYIKHSVNSINHHFEILTDFFEDITDCLYYVFSVQLENAQIEEKEKFNMDERKKLKHKERFLFENWREHCIFD